MAETKEVTRILVVTDSETSYDNVGDIDGGYIDKDWLKRYVKAYGPAGLFQIAAYINFQVFDAMREVNSEANSMKLSNNPAPQTGAIK